MDKNIKYWQQGDVTGIKLDSFPPGERKIIGLKRCVLAEGEVTGHAHVVEDDEAELVQIGEKILLNLTKAATVTHEEHKPVTLGPGIWEIGRVSEYDYFSQMVNPVKD